MSGKGDDRRQLSVDEKTFSDNWDRIFADKRDYYASVREKNYADSLRLEGLMGCSSTVERESLKLADVRSNRTTPAISWDEPGEFSAEAWDRIKPTYINADTGEQVSEDWWPTIEPNP